MIQFVAAGAVGALVWTGWKAFRREMDKLEREDALNAREADATLERDAETGRYRIRKDGE